MKKPYLPLLLLLLLSSTGFAGFSGPTQIGTGVMNGAVVLGDINNDGYLDLVVSGDIGGGACNLKLYTGNGDGTFVMTPIGSYQLRKSSLLLTDLNTDGYLDLVVSGEEIGGNKHLDKYINNHSGGFTFSGQIGSSGISCGSIAAGDMDNDGNIDLMVSGKIDGGVVLGWYRNTGDGNFPGVIQPIGSAIGVSNSSIALGDLDNDGDLDLVVSGKDILGTDHLDYYLNNTAGNFTGPTQLLISGNPYNKVSHSSIALGDLDNDGDLDLVVTGVYAGTTHRLDAYTNNIASSGNFKGAIIDQHFGLAYSSVALGDIDNDGDLDLIASGSTGWDAKLIAYTNRNTGGFSTNFISIGQGVSNSSIALGDLNNDGTLDLIVTGQDIGGVLHLDRYMNNSPTLNNPPTTAPRGMYSADTLNKWQFKWLASSDDKTKTNTLQYHIAIGTNSGVYNIISTNIALPRGQANLGNSVTTPGPGKSYFLSTFPTIKRYYWKVCAIDTSFKRSDYCPEQVTTPDIGPYYVSATKGSNNYNGLSTNTPFKTIQKAVDKMMPGVNITSATCYVMNGIYKEQVIIRSNKNSRLMTITAAPGDTPVLIGSNFWNAFTIYCGYVQISGFQIKKYSQSFYFTQISSIGASNNIINNNQIISNIGISIYLEQNTHDNLIAGNRISLATNSLAYGFYLSDSYNNTIYSNHISGNYMGISETCPTYSSNKFVKNVIFSNSMYGIYINNSSSQGFDTISSNKIFGNPTGLILYSRHTSVTFNKIHHNSDNGIFSQTLGTNLISHNTVYSNGKKGIAILSPGNSMVSNEIYGENQVHGIFVTNAHSQTISGNLIRDYSYFGISLFKSTNTRIFGNTIKNSPNTGIYINASFPYIYLNMLTNNHAHTVWFDNTGVGTFKKNNILNTMEVTATPPLPNARDNWWDTTIASLVCNRFPSSPKSNVIPYRLFGPVNIYGSTNSMPSVAISIATQTVQGKVRLNWNKVNGAVRYFVYRTNVNSFSNLSRNSVKMITTTTNCTNTGLPDGNYYYWITALDNGNNTQYTNESWYSPVKMAVVGPDFPSQVTGLTATPVSESSIILQWNDTPSEYGYKIYRGNSSATNTFTIPTRIGPNITNFSQTGLSPNAKFYFGVKATNSLGCAKFSAVASNYTYAAIPIVTCNRSNFKVYTNSSFTFTNKNHIGAGANGITGFRYKWVRHDPLSPSIGPITNSDSLGASPPTNFQLSLIAGSEGSWYLRLRSFNQISNLFCTNTYGPYKFFRQYIGPFKAGLTKAQIDPNKDETTDFINTTPLTNIYATPHPISDGKIFYIKILEGICTISGNGTTNGQAYSKTTNSGYVRFHISGKIVNVVKLKMYWTEDTNVSATVELLISPDMNLEQEKAVIYENVLNPEKGSQLDIYLSDNDQGPIEVRIYDIQENRLIKEIKTTGEYLKHVTYDLKMENGLFLPDKTYGVIIKGKNWKRERKFVVSRWFKK